MSKRLIEFQNKLNRLKSLAMRLIASKFSDEAIKAMNPKELNAMIYNVFKDKFEQLKKDYQDVIDHKNWPF